MATPPTEPAARRGLAEAEARRRLERDGPNTLPRAGRRRWPAMLLGIVAEPMILLLLAAAGVYLLLGDGGEAVALAVSVLAVIGLTLYQEQRSERALEALRELSSPRARVWRDGALRTVAARELVTGDDIELAEGDRVPADAELLAGADLDLDESMLTGESVPVRRHASADEASARSARAATLVVRGSGPARVVATGAATEVGRIGASLAEVGPSRTQLQAEMRRAVAIFAAIGITSCVLLVALVLARGGGVLEALLAGITLAISNIPEEFPVVLTVFLAIGAWRMSRRSVLVRRAPAIEALGSVTVLAADKTGTLTENRMRVQAALAGTTLGDGVDSARARLLAIAERACDREPHDPMERAIADAAAARAAGLPLRSWPLGDALLAVGHAWEGGGGEDGGHALIAVKGAPESVVSICDMAAGDRERALAAAARLAGEGLRVLAVASGSAARNALPAGLGDLRCRFEGLLGLADPLRAEAAGAVARARAAGVRVLMITGDHPETAAAIARQAGIDSEGGVLQGEDLARLDERALVARLDDVNVFARVRPEHKLRLVRALKSRGGIVAMTGDGVNDAPALAAADVGIAMGGRGTDVAREASSIVLLDDNVASIVAAIELGRRIYDNIRRAVRYIVAVHVPITVLAMLPLLLGAPMVLLPLHVVFLELIIDPSCSVVFEMERGDEQLMRRRPRPPAQRLLDAATLRAGLSQGALAAAAVVAVYLAASWLALPHAELTALVFSATVAGNLALIAVNRAELPVLRLLRRPNPAFWWVLVVASLALSVVLGLPSLAGWFGMAMPPPGALALALAGPTLAVLALGGWLRGRRPVATSSGGACASS